MSGFDVTHYPFDTDVLPKGWSVSSLQASGCEHQSGFASGEHNSEGRGIPHLRPMNINTRGEIDLSDVRFVTPVAGHRLKPGDVLFNNTNSPVHVGKTAHVDLDSDLAFSNHMTRIRCSRAVEPRFLASQLHGLQRSGYFESRCKKHVNQASISGLALTHETPVLLPPLPEQKRIVARLDALQARSRAAREALAEVPALLDTFRQSVLAAAFRGDLTAEWRAKNSNVEPASVLLERIRAERRQKWEHANPRKKYSEPAPIEASDLPDVPDGWAWVRVEEIAEWITKGTTPSAEKMSPGSGERPFVKVYNLTPTTDLDFSVAPTFISDATHRGELARSRCFPGDVLMNIVGPPLGKVSIIPNTHPEWNINQAIAVFRPISGLLSRYLATYLTSSAVVSRCRRLAKATAGQFNLTLEICRDIPIPLPPFDEQGLIVELTRGSAFSGLLGTTFAVPEMLAELDTLDQTILARAFRGDLVEQDPNDEPAEVLLARLRGEAAPPPKARRGRPASRPAAGREA